MSLCSRIEEVLGSGMGEREDGYGITTIGDSPDCLLGFNEYPF